MTQILLDVTRLISRCYRGLLPTGVDRVGLAYVQRYGVGARGVLSEYGYSAVLTDGDSQRTFAMLLAQRPDRRFIARLLARTWTVNRLRPAPNGSTLLHTSHTGMEYPRYYRSMRQGNGRAVFMVHDLIPLTHAEYSRPGVDDIHRKRIHAALHHADGLIANSQATLDSLAQEAKCAGLALPPSVVAPLAGGTEPQPAQAAPLASPYFVMLGTIEPRKNHWFMLHVWRRLVERLGDAAPKLVVIGRRGWECENVIDMLERCASLRGAVIEQSDCSDDQLHAWLQHARALLFPSFVEGYGMPLVEALASRVPVLASDLGVFREIAADIPDYLDPLDGPGWLARIEAYARADSPERRAQLARIAGFRAPTWAAHFDIVDRFIASLG
ncbi:glycosyltransferase family 4 protein [Burkholderia mayonis]|uniref:Glycosyl transferase family 1 n=1 Tax=Burkholderia mayonis TaxID=1385591 RepID=A0A1B4FZ63_9BURK|nr:glycosyltransferase family 1 protein [Burkholderia mayonis]AOJ08969.1 glycosyl transferase family 1 [Burkholderia mayonis]KVE55952.1 glycosyl transferase family 1 [Burkholderia mayonis]